MSTPISNQPVPQFHIPKEAAADKCAETAKHIDQHRMIFLSGTSTAGKSSIMSAFCQGNTESLALGIDDFFKDEFLPQLIQTHLPDDYRVLNKAFTDEALCEACNPDASIDELLLKNPSLMRADASSADREAARQLLADKSDNSFNNRFGSLLVKEEGDKDHAHFEAIVKKFQTGKTVIFDSPSTRDFFEYIQAQGIHIEGKVQHILVYLTLPQLVERASKRNSQAIESGNLSNRRPLAQVIHDFTMHYQKATSDDKVVDVLKREDIERLFQKHADEIEANNRYARERNGPQITQTSVLKHFGFQDGLDEIPITTSFRIPIGMLTSANQSPLQNAQSLKEHTFRRLF